MAPRLGNIFMLNLAETKSAFKCQHLLNTCKYSLFPPDGELEHTCYT